MRRNYTTPSNPLEDRIKTLESELYMARASIIGLMPDPLRAPLHSYYSVKSREDSYRWREDVAQQIIDQATILPQTVGYLGDRAMCPLCGDGSSSPYEKGFSMPEGLRRHLVGFGNTRQCVVTLAAFALARDHWNSQFRATEEESDRARQAEIKRRKQVETLYRVDLRQEPVLLEEGVSTFHEARSANDIEWAEQRLDTLGFSITVEDRVKAYVSEVQEFLVLADPRQKGEISFRIFKKPAGKTRRPGTSVGWFAIPDRWKHDLRAKYDAALAKFIV
ncbi:hypothetical protein PQQ87_16005 [Paraburkholderia nemoris]|uniref:hypothetical protein n=1 Tax=Paraburkholderia nemoris TaxID=2793076 RepID=UPI0038BA53AD